MYIVHTTKLLPNCGGTQIVWTCVLFVGYFFLEATSQKCFNDAGRLSNVLKINAINKKCKKKNQQQLINSRNQVAQSGIRCIMILKAYFQKRGLKNEWVFCFFFTMS